MSTDLETINNTYGKLIWSISNRYRMGIWDATDVYNQILLQLYQALEKDKMPEGDLVENFGWVKSFVICRAIDIIRREYKQKGIGSIYNDRRNIDYVEEVDISGNGFDFDEEINQLDTPATPSEYEYEMEKRFVWEMLITHLPNESAVFIFELAFPTPETIDIAMQDQQEAKNDTSLRMNCNHLRILPRHVAQSLGPAFNLSKASMSRIKKKAREVIGEVMEVNRKNKTCHVS